MDSAEDEVSMDDPEAGEALGPEMVFPDSRETEKRVAKDVKESIDKDRCGMSWIDKLSIS